MPFDKAELHFAKAALYQEYKTEGENIILPFNPIAFQAEEEDDGEVVEPKWPSKIRRVTRPNGWVVYELWQLKEGDEEDGKPDSLNLAQQPEEVHTTEEFVKEALECMNDGVKNVQELVEVNLGDGEEDEKMVKISKNLSKKERGKLVALLKEYKDVFA